MKYIFLCSILLITACSDQSLKSYINSQPKLELRDFFNGSMVANGIVQDRSGTVIKTFVVNMNNHWEGDTATLSEKFNYSDGTKSERIWKLKEIADKKYEGRAGDVIGVANGEVVGNTFHFEYDLDLVVKDLNYKVHFNDWMYLLDKETLIARSYMTKWGISLCEVTIVMRKIEAK